MRYVFVSFNYSPAFTSPQNWFDRVEGYLGTLEELGKKNEVINVKQIDYEGNCMYHGVKHLFVKFAQKKLYFPIRLSLYIKKLRPDIVFVHGLHFPLQVILLKLILSRNVKIIAQHHAEKPFTGIKKYIQRLADTFIDAYLFASKTMGTEWVKNGNIARVDKLHEVMEVSSIFHPIKKETAKLKSGVTGGTIYLWVGRLNANKDPLNVVNAFLKFSEIAPDARLYMIYHTNELLEEISEMLSLRNKGNIILVGQVPHPELLYWFNSADFFISGSHYEGSGTALCEAMSCGCVPVVTDIPAFRMITDNGNCGLLFEAGNELSLLSALKQTTSVDKEEKKTKSIAYYQSNLSFEAIASRIQGVADSFSIKK